MIIDNFIGEHIIPLMESVCIDAIGDRDGYTHNHCLRVQLLSSKIYMYYFKHLKAKAKNTFKNTLKKYILYPENSTQWSDEKKEKYLTTYLGSTSLRRAALLHDLGKLSWSDILLKGSSRIQTNSDAHDRITHPMKGAQAVNDQLTKYRSSHATIDVWILIMIFHHWDYNGTTGYPKIQTIQDSPLKTLVDVYINSLTMKTTTQSDLDPIRVLIGIIRICDSIDAMTSNRNYKSNNLTWDEALQKINAENINQNIYHPDVLKVLNINKDALAFYFDTMKIDFPDNSNPEIKCFHCKETL